MPTQKSDVWNISMIETEYGKMFKISAKEFVPQVHTNVELNPENDLPSSPNATVEVFVELSGRNEWWAGGSGFNIYHERLGTTFEGEKHGWFSVTGELVEDEGLNLPAQIPRPLSRK